MAGKSMDGSVEVRELRVKIVDVTVHAFALDSDDYEVVIRVNGYPLSRMNSHRARRMGIVTDGPGIYGSEPAYQ